MKIFILSLIVFWVISDPSYCQVKRPSSKQPDIKPVKVKVGPLKQDDYDHYFFVSRNGVGDNDTKPYYTVSSQEKDPWGNNLGNYTNQWMILDVRTGKEVGWWPQSLSTVFSPINQQLYVLGARLILGHSASGVFQYQTYPGYANDSKYSGTVYFLSIDYRKAIFLYNKDIMIADFDIKTGKVGIPKQITFAGVFGFQNIFMKDDFIITDRIGGYWNYIIDTKTGKFTRCGEWSEKNGYITDMFVAGDNVNDKIGYWKATTQEFKPFKSQFRHLFWANKEQTEYVYAETQNDKTNYFFYSPKKSNNPILLNWPWAVKNEIHFDNYGESLNIPRANRELFSPNHHKFLLCEHNFIVLYDIDSNSETTLNLKLHLLGYELKGMAYEKVWTDDEHFFFVAEPGNKVENIVIDNSTQGTYVYDIKNHKATRVTPYMMTPRSNNDGLYGPGIKLLRFPKANWVVFQANNYLFRCRPDGTEVTMLTKSPLVYTLRKNFLDESIDLK